MKEFSPTLKCPCNWEFCESAFAYSARPDGETEFDLGGSEYRRGYDRCMICEHYVSRHCMDLSNLYISQYLDATYGNPEGMRERLEKILGLPPHESDNAGRLDCIESYRDARGGMQGAQKRLLDIGAGIGVFPAAMKKAGWKVTAVEPDNRTAEYLNEVVGIEVHAGTLFDLSTDKLGTYDLVSFNKVLEHVEDPVSLLAKSREFVAPGGLVYIELPDVAAASEGPQREEFFIEHHHVFSPASLAMMVARAGLTPEVVERLREPSGKFTLRAFLLP